MSLSALRKVVYVSVVAGVLLGSDRVVTACIRSTKLSIHTDPLHQMISFSCNNNIILNFMFMCYSIQFLVMIQNEAFTENVISARKPLLHCRVNTEQLPAFSYLKLTEMNK